MRVLFATLVLAISGVTAALAVGVPAMEAGGGGYGACFPTPRDGVDEPVVIEGTCFEPAVLYVEPGTTVEWQQRDLIPHNVTMFSGELLGDDLEMSKGDSVSRTFETLGVFPYYCSIHTSMIGAVVVGDPGKYGFGYTLALQTTVDQLQAVADYKQEWLQGITPPRQEVGGQTSGVLDSGAGWGEVAIGLALFGGLLVGLVAVGGGFRVLRR